MRAATLPLRPAMSKIAQLGQPRGNAALMACADASMPLSRHAFALQPAALIDAFR